LPIAKKIAVAQDLENYNILQNNGKIAHQVMRFPTLVSYTTLTPKQDVPHVHFHVIPKPTASDDAGLVIGWPTQPANMDELKALQAELLGKL
jgi:diadenosine tetraphosphate (Ap4A) HIT family hydrolase